MKSLIRDTIAGRAISVRGNDIDTDRIIPARFLKCVTFDGLGEHAFEDDREQLGAKGETHPFDNPAFQGATLLFANKNFGCGSSREHAPQSIMRWGIGGIVGESFAEIFLGNCVALGVPCVTVSDADIQELMSMNQSAPDTVFTLDLDRKVISFGDKTIPIQLSEGARRQFLEGKWDSTAELLGAHEQVAATAAKLPYFNNWV